MIHLLSMPCVVMKVLSHASVKKETKRLKGFRLRTLWDVFSSDIMAVKGVSIMFTYLLIPFDYCLRNSKYKTRYTLRLRQSNALCPKAEQMQEAANRY